MGPGPMHPPQETCSCCCITAIIFSIVAVIALIFGGLYFGGYIFADDSPDAFKCTSLKDIVTSTNAHNAKRAKLTEGTKKWKIHRPDAKPAKSFYTHSSLAEQKKAAPGIKVALPNKTSLIGRLAKGQPAKKEWWFCGAQCKKLYESDKFDHSKLAGREKEIERRYGSTNRRQKLCLLCMHTNDTHRAKGRDGDDIDVESSDEHGRTGPKLREAAIMAVLKKGVTDLKV